MQPGIKQRFTNFLCEIGREKLCERGQQKQRVEEAWSLSIYWAFGNGG